MNSYLTRSSLFDVIQEQRKHIVLDKISTEHHTSSERTNILKIDSLRITSNIVANVFCQFFECNNDGLISLRSEDLLQFAKLSVQTPRERSINSTITKKVQFRIQEGSDSIPEQTESERIVLVL